MSYFGEAYVEVDASVLNPGISPMAAISGTVDSAEGSSSLTLVLRWEYDGETGEGGFSGRDWYYDDPYNIIPKNFQGTEEEFKNYLMSEQPENLDRWLAGWSSEDMANFCITNWSTLAPTCITPV